jgi:hypothetical protein
MIENVYVGCRIHGKTLQKRYLHEHEREADEREVGERGGEHAARQPRAAGVSQRPEDDRDHEQR